MFRRSALALRRLTRFPARRRYSTESALETSTFMRNEHHVDPLTPLLSLTHLLNNARPGVRLFAKPEYLNPSGAIKDRMAGNIISRSLELGLLNKSQTVVAASSGNTMAAVARIAKQHSVNCKVITNPKCSDEKKNIAAGYGATVRIEGVDVYQDKELELAEENPEKYFAVDQYRTELNPETYEQCLGPEIWQQTDGTVTHFVSGASTGGTIAGTTRYLRRQTDNLTVTLADPYGSVLHASFREQKARHDPNNAHLWAPEEDNSKYSDNLIEGVGRFEVTPVLRKALEENLVDESRQYTSDDAMSTCHLALNQADICIGGSSGGSLFIAMQVAENAPEDSTVVVVLADRGQKYLSKIFNLAWLAENDLPKTLAAFDQNKVDKIPAWHAE